PHNAMIASDGTAKLVDFGIAKAAIADRMTHEHVFKGKLAYAAPEQLRGAATSQSDVWALAVVLWELVVGHHIHDSAPDGPAIIARVFAGRLPTILDAAGGRLEHAEDWRRLVAIDTIVRRGLAIELADRWPSAAAMAEALGRAVLPATPAKVAQ